MFTCIRVLSVNIYKDKRVIGVAERYSQLKHPFERKAEFSQLVYIREDIVNVRRKIILPLS